MRRHETDWLSLSFGGLFLVIAAVHVAADGSADPGNLRWFIPGVLLSLGVLGLLGATRDERPVATEAAGSGREPRPAAPASRADEPTERVDRDEPTERLDRDEQTERLDRDEQTERLDRDEPAERLDRDEPTERVDRDELADEAAEDAADDRVDGPAERPEADGEAGPRG